MITVVNTVGNRNVVAFGHFPHVAVAAFGPLGNESEVLTSTATLRDGTVVTTWINLRTGAVRVDKCDRRGERSEILLETIVAPYKEAP